jgi:hypothetical protein
MVILSAVIGYESEVLWFLFSQNLEYFFELVRTADDVDGFVILFFHLFAWRKWETTGAWEQESFGGFAGLVGG